MPTPLPTGPQRAVTNTWLASHRFYTDALGYQLPHEGPLTERQRTTFGPQGEPIERVADT